MNTNDEDSQSNEPAQQFTAASDGGYHFNDPHFVGWWLDSLYLLPLDEQVVVAERLRERVGILEVHSVINEFVDERTPVTSFIGAPYAEESVPEGAPEFEPLPASTVAVAAIRRMWTERRPLLIFLGLILGIYAMRGVLFVFDYFQALVTG